MGCISTATPFLRGRQIPG